ncbi:MAG: AmmeMemoRadiSam system radical SAM enzyme [Gammaproteobacteria bacterium]|nr:AmmeMemoRadiSam system radical SAM enzyme [Gammaproteobacteria bacterium]
MTELNINPHPAKYWHKLANGRIQCDVCPRACQLKPGQRGFCFVRARAGEQMVLTTYGLSSGMAIDPIEKKPLNHFLPGTKVFSLGTAGCNLACRFCQNWNISKSREMDILAHKAMPRDIAAAAAKHGCASVAFTYNEPTIFLEYAIDTAKECHKLGIKTVAVTNGYICDAARQEFYAHMDATNVDLKGFTDKFYKKLIGGTLQPVLDTLCYLKQHTEVWFEITTLLIPGENDSAAEIDQSTKWVVENLGPDVPMHFTAFHPAWKMQDKPATLLATLQLACDIAKQNGVRYAYTGNIYDVAGTSSYCHNCGKRIVERESYRISSYQLNAKGECKFCATPCAGRFAEKLGGSRFA